MPVLRCVDALRAAGASVELLTASDESEIDTATKAVEAGGTRLIVAAASDAELRAVLRRLVRRNAPPPSKRPVDLPPKRTVYDLPPLAVLPLAPSVPDLVGRLGLPAKPEEVAAATVAGTERRFDLLRHDGGSVTANGVMLGGLDSGGQLAPWQGRVEVDDVVLSDGADPVIACAIRNAGSSDVEGLPLVTGADPADGLVEVAIAVPVMKRRLLREASVHYEVRRARGRAVSITPHAASVRYVDDGVVGTLGRKRSWWIEPAVWSAYVM